MANDTLRAKVLSEGYCCMYGYIRLCHARKELSEGMAKNLNAPARTIRYNEQLYRQGRHVCQCQKDCMKPQIEAVEALQKKGKGR